MTAAAATQSDTVPRLIGHWITAKIVDELTDSSTWSAMLTTESGEDKEGSLFVRCKGNVLDINVAWGEDLFSEDFDVRWRLDSAPPVRGNWTPVGSQHATWRGDPYVLIAKLSTAHRLIVRGEGNRIRTVTFNLDSTAQAVAPLLRECPEARSPQARKRARDSATALVNEAREKATRAKEIADSIASWDGEFIGARTPRLYYKKACAQRLRLSPSERVPFKTHEQAQEAGYDFRSPKECG